MNRFERKLLHNKIVATCDKLNVSSTPSPDAIICELYRITAAALCSTCKSRLRIDGDHVCEDCINEAKR